jgi:hypothetical protein
MSTGYNTYLMALLLGLNEAAGVLGWVDAEAQNSIRVLLGSGGLVFLRAGIKKDTHSL